MAPVFEDDFSSKNAYWGWRIDSHASHEATPEGSFLFRVSAEADALDYSNAEIYEANAALPWLRVRAVFRIANPAIQAGSRGWGFWNGSMDAGTSVIAWFMYIDGTGGAAAPGFYACTQAYGGVPVQTAVTGVDLTAWHDYEVDWREDRVVFSVDGHEAAVHDFSPDTNMRLDVWVDNSVYDASWEHVYQDIPADSTLTLDRIRVYSD